MYDGIEEYHQFCIQGSKRFYCQALSFFQFLTKKVKGAQAGTFQEHNTSTLSHAKVAAVVFLTSCTSLLVFSSHSGIQLIFH